VNSGPRLLLVDDHRLLRQGLRRAVEEAGFEVVGEAGDGEEAVRLASALRPDLVLMDVSMPVLDGIEATRRLRGSVPDTRVVILTMHGEESVIDRALRAGAAAYLLKDCSTDEVAATLKAVAAGDTDLTKPAPDPYLRAAELHGVPPAACVAIEDSHWGLESARAAGMRTIAITHTYPRDQFAGAADAIVSSLAELTRDFISRL